MGKDQNRDSAPFHPGLGLGLAVLAASSAAILIRFAQTEVDSLAIAAYRLSLATLILLPIALRNHGHELRGISGPNLARALLAGCFLAAHFAAWITSLMMTSVASSVLLVQTSPLFVALSAPFVLHERASARSLFGLALAFSGTAVIAGGDLCGFVDLKRCILSLASIDSTALMGDALALLGGLAGAGYILLGRRARGELSLIPYVTLAYGAAALVLTLSAWISGAAMTGYSLRAYLWLLLLALLPQLFAHSTYNWALRYLPAALVSLALLGEPVASALWAALILGERPGLTVIIGGLLVISGITLGSSGSVAADSMSNETARPASTGGR